MKILIYLSILLYASHLFAKCDCPLDRDIRGRICGRRAAFCKPGGREPKCGTRTASEKMALLQQACRKNQQ